MEKILIVEDEWIESTEIQGMIEDLGYEVIDVVDNGEAAIESVSEVEPDLILMDIRLGEGMSGIETVKTLREDYEVPVVYLTAHSDEDTLSRAKETDPEGYLVKPITTDDLRSTLQLIL